MDAAVLVMIFNLSTSSAGEDQRVQSTLHGDDSFD